jgi:hypothetical protein
VGELKVRKHMDAKGIREQASNLAKTRTWKIHHKGPTWTRSASFSALLSEALWSRNSCHSACSAWALSKWVGGAPA